MTTNDDQPSTTSGLPSYGSTPPPPEGSYPPPPPEGSYPPPPGGGPPPVPGASGFSATKAISYGWKKFQENLGPVLLATLAIIVITAAVSFVAGAITDTRGFGDDPFSIGGSIYQIITSFVEFIVGAVVIRGALDVTEGHKFNLTAAFGKLNIANVVLTALLVAVLSGIGYALLWVPGVLVAFFTGFALYFAVDKGTNPVDSIKQSFRLVKDNVGNTIVMILMTIAVILVGLIALCVGIFAAIPVVVFAWAYTYKVFLGEPVAP